MTIILKIIAMLMLLVPGIVVAKTTDMTPSSREVSSEKKKKTAAECQVELKREKRDPVYTASVDCQRQDDERRFIPQGLDREADTLSLRRLTEPQNSGS